MQLSIIVPNVSNNTDLKNVLSTYKYQDNQDFELILSLTNPGKIMYGTIEKYLDFFGSRLKFIVNNKRTSVQAEILSAFHLVKGKYSYIFFPDNAGRYYFVSRMIELTHKYDTEIIEFRPRLVNSIRWKPNPRVTQDTIFKIEKYPEVVAYSYPFIFNKIFKSTLLHKFDRLKIKEFNDSKFCIFLTYILLTNACSYAYYGERIVRENISSNLWLAPNSFISQFDILLENLKTSNTKLQYEVQYAKYYFLQIFLAGLLKTWRKGFSVFNYFKNRSNFLERRSKKYADDLYKYLQRQQNNDSLFFDTNIYVNKNTFESKLIKTLTDIEKWDNALEKM
ncbi:glycosyl transferase [Mycoplasma tauri]|uniref:Glycosyl transferase n=1 Tax=Mycoplasma tauri TaxID=547987 RepID=A0A953T6T3_9MOLU|nr:glycosyl transferase [Mycoplasma tauri]MBZ4195511.1 glycosyl transferase [Mycoplasma tauri]MBZ4203803.1 glycosyl transferase [Mycoplasma tauri]MBZ4204100.1 glycosyl transferase [Mycoplasma tauri]MBZ4212496.1 glycosyl transferase [Mycoplasma tauri]MBZ4218254.1 glycosyl transferase [Mycoplasma tauri]